MLSRLPKNWSSFGLGFLGTVMAVPALSAPQLEQALQELRPMLMLSRHDAVRSELEKLQKR